MFSIKQRDLYPTSVYVADIYDAKENEEYKKFLIDLSKRDKGRSYISKKGYQSDPILWKEKVFESLLEKSSYVTETIIKNITGQNVYFSGNNEEVLQTTVRSMWGNVTPKGGYNFIHVHPSAWMSAVYYIQIPNDDSPLIFQDPRPARMMDYQRTVLINDEYYEHQCKVGELILFPAWLPHYVNPNTSDELRISMSFNIELLC